MTDEMEEIAPLCERVILLKDGTSHAYGAVREVQEQFGGAAYGVSHTGGIPPLNHYTLVDTQLAGEGQVSELAPAPSASETTVLAELVGTEMPVSGFTTAWTSLEEIFIRVYGADSLDGATETETVGVGA